MEFATKTFRIFLMLVTFTCIIKMSSIFFQAVGQPVKAGIVSLLRDIVCFVPLVIILPNFLGVEGTLYAAPIADLIGIICTSILVLLFFKNLGKEKVETKKVSTALKKSHKGVIVTISRQHGSQGKYIGELVAKQLDIPYYYKEMTAIAAKESGLDKEFISNLHLNSPNALNDLYLSTSPVQYAIQAQDRVIKEIASQGSCVIVGRAADYVLRDNKNLVRIFIYAPKDYRVSNIMEMYNDTEQEAIKNVEKSDKTRGNYYKTISGLEWGKRENYDLCIDSSIGKEECARIICEYVKSRK
jgi:cytidylate kinase